MLILSIKKKIQKTKNNSDRITEYNDSEVKDKLTEITAIPKQPNFYKIPRRFGSIPVDQLPLGCDKDKQYTSLYPRVPLPFQKADRITFGSPKLEPNRLFWGDNLHVMRMLKSNSIDLIYIDPPFFSGANYNVIFGDQNEKRSFSDIWEGGMHSYLIWFNARLLEMKRLLKSTGSIYVHLDYHASHYVKIEMDKIFGYDNFRNEIIWCYTGPGKNKSGFPRKHDTIFRYTKSDNFLFSTKGIKIPYSESFLNRRKYSEGKAGIFGPKYLENDNKKTKNDYEDGKSPEDWWTGIPSGGQISRNERIGYPTQKPEALLERIIKASSNEGDVVADFFCGGGGTPTVAQKLNRNWIACDQSRVAVAITQSRLETLHEKTSDARTQQKLTPVPDISIEYWGTYEIPTLEALSNIEFRSFVITAFGGNITTGDGFIHGYKRDVPLFVGSTKQNSRVTKNDVIEFVKEFSEKKGLKKGVMLAWSFSPSVKSAVDQIQMKNGTEVDMIQITLTELDSPTFKIHITKLHDDYKSLLTFILPPEVTVLHKRVTVATYKFDATNSIPMNIGAKIVNVQWDFDYKDRFTPTQGFAFGRESDTDKIKPLFVVEYKFKYIGKKSIACRVQDDLGGEKIYTEVLNIK